MKHRITWTALYETVVEVPDGYSPEECLDNINIDLAGSSFVKHSLEFVESVPEED
jgi:hypothetical protein